MSEDSILWSTNGVGDGAAEITRAQWLDFFEMLFLRDKTTQGVAAGYLSALAVSSTGNNNARVASGGAVVRGLLYRSTANVDHTIASPVADTGFRVVLRATWSTQQVRSAVVMNTTGVTAAPALTQADGTTWEISLATGTITSGGVIAVTSAPTFLYYNTKVSTVMIDDISVTTGKLADDSVTNAKIGDDAVNTPQLADDSVTQAQLADDSVGSAQIIAAAVGSPEIAGGAVGTTELADDSVTDAKAGERIIQLSERQGTSATDWQDSGSTTIAPGAIRMQVGARNITINAGNADAILQNLTYPTAYADKPWINVTIASTSTQKVVWQIEGITATDFDIRVTRKDETDTGSGWTVLALWQSIGGA